MTTWWLRDALKTAQGVTTDGGNPILLVEFGERTERVYCPDSDEYRVTADVVQKARDLGATIVAFSNAWCEATYEAKEYGKKHRVSVMPYGSLFAYLRRYGVIIAE